MQHENKNSKAKGLLAPFIIACIIMGARNTILDKTNYMTTDTQSSSGEQTQSTVDTQKNIIIEAAKDNTAVISNAINDIDALRSLSYRYSSLSESDRSLYDQMYTAIRNHMPEYEITGEFTTDDINRVRNVMDMTDEYFMIVRPPGINILYSKDTNLVSKIMVDYKTSKEEDDDVYKKSMAAVNDIVKNVGGMTQYEAEKYFHDSIIDTTRYDHSYVSNPYSETNDDDTIHNASGVFIRHMAVCDGYSKAFKILCNRIGIPCDIISGTGSSIQPGSVGGPHAWNLITLDGENYTVDVTYDDTDEYDFPTYDFFNQTQTECDEYHIPDNTYSFPQANGTYYNYYSMTGNVASNPDEFCAILDNYVQNTNESYIHIKTKDPYHISDIKLDGPEMQHIAETIYNMTGENKRIYLRNATNNTCTVIIR